MTQTTDSQVIPRTPQVLYDRDFMEWTQTMARLLREGHLDQIDIENIAEEIESLGKRDRREVTSRLEVLLMHLLKLQYQPQKTIKSWPTTITEQRRQIQLILDDSPSLSRYLTEQFCKCYHQARRSAANETGLPLVTFPDNCPWSIDETLNFES